MTTSNIHDEVLEFCSTYVRGDFGAALRMYRHMSMQVFETGNTAFLPYAKFFSNGPRAPATKAVAKLDPFMQRYFHRRCWDQNGPLNQHISFLNSFPGNLSARQVEDIYLSFMPGHDDPCLGLNNFLGLIIPLYANDHLDLIDDALQTTLKLAARLEAIDIAIVLHWLNLTKGEGFVLHRIYHKRKRESGRDNAWSPDEELIERCKRLLEFEISAKKKVLSFVSQLRDDQVFPGFSEFKANTCWRYKVLKDCRLLLQLYAYSRSFEKARALTDMAVDIAHDFVTQAVSKEQVEFYWGANSTYMPAEVIDPLDPMVDPEIRRFLIMELIRFYKALFADSKVLMLVRLRNALALMNGEELEPEPLIPQPKIESYESMLERSDPAEILKPYVRTHWRYWQETGPITFGFATNGARRWQFMEISSPSDFTDTLTPERVEMLIDVVNRCDLMNHYPKFQGVTI